MLVIDHLNLDTVCFNPADLLILVVDDINDNLHIMGSILDQAGYNTTYATSGQQALERVKAALPDLILLDLMMPGMDGIEVCEQLKLEPAYRHIPIVFLTASREQEKLLSAFQQGASDYLMKPVTPAELLARVKVHLEQKLRHDQLNKNAEKFYQMAIKDPLTGVSNRYHLMTVAEQEFSRAGRYQRPLSVIMLDIDHFKQVNDTYGHDIGDEVLKQVAQVSLASLRGGDLFGRLGGEEFMVLLPETNLEKATVVAKRLCTAVSQSTFQIDQVNVPLTISIGVSSIHADDTDIGPVLKRADQALYEAKQQGRNQVRSLA
jgi:diguanylate cyclase (GGDEF)-like protein